MHPCTCLLFVFSVLGLQAQSPGPEAAPSFIATPVRIDLGPVLAAAERNTPRVPPGVETWINLPGTALSSPAYRFNLYRDPLIFTLNGKRLVLHTTVNYWMEVGLRMKGWVKGMGACGRAPQPFRRAQLGLAAELGITPDWNLDLKITPEEPLRMDRCEVTYLGYDITDKVLAGMKDSLVKAAVSMEQQIKVSTVLKQRAQAVWLQAQQPLELRPGLFLMLNPERVRLAPWTSQDKELTITPELQVRPVLTLGQRPSAQTRPLPPLDLSNDPIQPGFHLRVEADFPFAQATAQMSEQMVGKRFETSHGKFEILKVAIRSKDGLALLDIGLKGRVDGTLTLAGKPVFDPKTGQVQLADLDYTLESKSWITQFGEWLFRSNLRKTLTEKCSWFMNDGFKNLRTQAQLGLNRTLSPELSMTGTMNSLTVKQVEVLPDRFRVVAQLEGQVQITVKAAL